MSEPIKFRSGPSVPKALPISPPQALRDVSLQRPFAFQEMNYFRQPPIRRPSLNVYLFIAGAAFGLWHRSQTRKFQNSISLSEAIKSREAPHPKRTYELRPLPDGVRPVTAYEHDLRLVKHELGAMLSDGLQWFTDLSSADTLPEQILPGAPADSEIRDPEYWDLYLTPGAPRAEVEEPPAGLPQSLPAEQAPEILELPGRERMALWLAMGRRKKPNKAFPTHFHAKEQETIVPYRGPEEPRAFFNSLNHAALKFFQDFHTPVKDPDLHALGYLGFTLRRLGQNSDAEVIFRYIESRIDQGPLSENIAAVEIDLDKITALRQGNPVFEIKGNDDPLFRIDALIADGDWNTALESAFERQDTHAVAYITDFFSRLVPYVDDSKAQILSGDSESMGTSISKEWIHEGIHNVKALRVVLNAVERNYPPPEKPYELLFKSRELLYRWAKNCRNQPFAEKNDLSEFGYLGSAFELLGEYEAAAMMERMGQEAMERTGKDLSSHAEFDPRYQLLHGLLTKGDWDSALQWIERANSPEMLAVFAGEISRVNVPQRIGRGGIEEDLLKSLLAREAEFWGCEDISKLLHLTQKKHLSTVIRFLRPVLNAVKSDALDHDDDFLMNRPIALEQLDQLLEFYTELGKKGNMRLEDARRASALVRELRDDIRRRMP